jgi:hypothetical protein
LSRITALQVMEIPVVGRHGPDRSTRTGVVRLPVHEVFGSCRDQGPPRATRTGFWRSLFRFQGAVTAHTQKAVGACTRQNFPRSRPGPSTSARPVVLTGRPTIIASSPPEVNETGATSALPSAGNPSG